MKRYIIKRITNANTNEGRVVILSEHNNNSFREMLYLASFPKVRKKLSEGLNAKVEDCTEFHW